MMGSTSPLGAVSHDTQENTWAARACQLAENCAKIRHLASSEHGAQTPAAARDFRLHEASKHNYQQELFHERHPQYLPQYPPGDLLYLLADKYKSTHRTTQTYIPNPKKFETCSIYAMVRQTPEQIASLCLSLSLSLPIYIWIYII